MEGNQKTEKKTKAVKEKVSSKETKPVKKTTNSQAVKKESNKETKSNKKKKVDTTKVAKSKITIPKSGKSAQKNVKSASKEPKNIKILGYNDLQLNTYLFDEVEKPKAVVVLVHGMQEHCLRYTNFARYLNKNGFIVILSDLRGHGHTAINKNLLGYGEKDIFTETLADQINIINFANEKYNLPIYLFGHSYGSMLSQNLIQLTPLVEKCVLCGTGNGDSFIMNMGNIAVTLLSPFKNKNSKGGLIEKMCIKSYGKKFERGNWLTRDEKVFDAYLQDEYCGGSFPFSFYKSLLKNIHKTNKGIEKIGSKKVFLIAGDNDPVGENGKQVTKLYKLYLKKNVNAKFKLYKGARHELINEICKEEVFKDIVDFYNS